MHETMEVSKAIEGMNVGVTTSAAESGVAKLRVLHREVAQTMPKSATQEIRVIFARLEPGDQTPFHTHRFPVTVYMLEGTFTLELDGLPIATIGAGEVFVEPPHVRMTGRNLDTEVSATMILFYVSDPETPFADPVA